MTSRSIALNKLSPKKCKGFKGHCNQLPILNICWKEIYFRNLWWGSRIWNIFCLSRSFLYKNKASKYFSWILIFLVRKPCVCLSDSICYKAEIARDVWTLNCSSSIARSHFLWMNWTMLLYREYVGCVD